MGESKYTMRHPNMRGVQIYRGHPNIQGGIKTYAGVQTYRGHPNIKGTSKLWVVSKHMGASKHTGGIQTYGVEGIQIYRWSSKHTVGVSKHIGGIQPYKGHPNIWWHTNVWGHMDTPLG